MIPEATLQQIQDRLDIVEIISGYVSLKRVGKNFKACCPFHQEKTPSFMVNQDKQIFHCFGCGAGGNVFGFLMKIEKKDFPEAVEALAERAGIEIPKDRPVNQALAERSSQLLKAQTMAADFFHRCLMEKKDGQRARAYLTARGLSDETIKNFRIGFAPAGWEALYNELSKDIPQSVLEKTGLVIAKKEGGFYDRFRERVMFPIVDAKGHCVAFGGRVLDESLPKYLNSPETEIYSKGRNLYGLHQAVKAIRENDSVIFVEGYMDVIVCHQAGVTQVVASLGTALTHDQARLVKRSTKNVTMLYDADKAGEMATLRGLEIFLEEGMEVKIVRLPGGHDPDSYILKHGVLDFRKQLAEAQSLFDYKLALLKKTYDVRTIEGKVKIANDMVSIFSKAQNEILKSAWVKELSKDLSLSEEALLHEMRRDRDKTRVWTAEPGKPLEKKESVGSVERLLIGLLLTIPGTVERVRGQICLEDVKSQAALKILRRILEGPALLSAGALMREMQEDAAGASLLSAAIAETAELSDPERALRDCLMQLKRLRIRSDREELMARVVQAERSGDEQGVKKFMSQISELNKKERQINEKK